MNNNNENISNNNEAIENPYMELRKIALGLHSKEGRPGDVDKVNAVLVDTNDGQRVFSIVAVADGNCSMYFDNGKFLIGLGKKDEDIARAAKLFTMQAEKALTFIPKVTNTDVLPAPYRRTFYLVTDGGIYRTIAPTDDPMGMPFDQTLLTNLLSNLMKKIHTSPLMQPSDGSK